MNSSITNKTTGILRLDNTIRSCWEEMFSSIQAQNFVNHTMYKDPRIYALYMTQVYHYASYTPRNLALAGANILNKDVRFMHHCFEHAMEETGHELMALSDLRHLGVVINDPETDMPPPLPSTQKMIAFVKDLATGPSPYKTLGFSYWIERPYEHIFSFLMSLKIAMGLKDEQMSFYLKHMEIDQKHGNDIEDIVIKISVRDEHWSELEAVTRTTMKFLFNMLVEIIDEYKKLISGNSKLFSCLNSIQVKS